MKEKYQLYDFSTHQLVMEHPDKETAKILAQRYKSLHKTSDLIMYKLCGNRRQFVTSYTRY